MASYPKQSSLSQDEWSKIMTTIREIKESGIEKIDFSIEDTWNGFPVGKMLEKIRLLRVKNLLTQEEMRFFRKYNIDLQYLARRWYYMFNRAKEYYLRYGHLSVISKEDYELSKWVTDQRRRFIGGPRKRNNRVAVYTPLSEDQKRLLEEIEIVWDTSSTWYKYSPLLKKYYEEMHDTNVPTTFFVGHLNLGHWVNSVRRGYFQLTDDQKQFLDSMKFDWDIRTVANTSFPEQATLYYFSFCYPDAQKTKEGGKELDIYSEKAKIAIEYDGVRWHKNKLDNDNKKDEYCVNNGIRLIRIREEGLPSTKYATNYFISLPFSTETFDTLLRKIFQKEFGNPLVDIDTRTHGFEILKNYRKLEDMAFYRHLDELREYIKKHHSFPSIKPPRSELANWVLYVRQVRKGLAHGVLTNEQIRDLDELGFVWNPYEKRLNDLYIHLKLYLGQGHDYLSGTYVDPVDNFALGRKIKVLRYRGPLGKKYKGTKLTKEWEDRFTVLGVNWNHNEPLLIHTTNQNTNEGNLL